MKSLIVVAPDHLRAGLRGCSLAKQLDRIEQLTSPAAANVEHRVTVLTLRSITARIRFLFAQTDELDPELHELITQHPAGPGAARRARRRPRRRRAAASELVPPRPRPLRSSLRHPRRRRTPGSQQRTTDSAPTQPRR